MSNQTVESAGQQTPFFACFILSEGTEVEVTLNVTSSPETAFRMSAHAFMHISEVMALFPHIQLVLTMKK